MKKRFILFALILTIWIQTPIRAQRISVAANVIDCLDFGTFNAEFGVALGRHFSVSAGAKYNPWKFGNGEAGTIQNCRRSVNAGMRWWPWNIHSGWWFSVKGQWEEYSRSLPSYDGRAEEGDAVGAGFSIGYALMLNRHFNIDFGLGAWGGGKSYTTYACPRCGRILERGRRGFILPNDIQASLVYIF